MVMVLLGFSIRNFSVVARSLEVGGGVTPPCLGKHVKPLVPAVIRRIFDSRYG